jgi:putative polymerase
MEVLRASNTGHDVIPVDSSSLSKLGPRIVIAALLFNLVLCFIQTRNWVQIANPEIAACELVIMLAGFSLMRQRITEVAMRIMGVIVVYEIGIKLINPGLDLKILHDVAIMYIFYEIGTMYSVEAGNRLLWTAMAIVLVVGFFELLSPALFGDVFDVWDYYVNKGVIGQDVVNYSQTNLFLSGNRGAAASRTFFPGLLGPHRVSSVFLEPDSLGNFAAIAFAWCLSTSIGKRSVRAVLFGLAMLCFVLADSRFASGCCLLMLILRFTIFRSKFIVFLLPVMMMSALTVVGSIHELPGVVPSIQGDNLAGRLLFSGRLLNYWDVQQWFGFAASPVYTADTGYAYVINNLGLPLALFLLGIFAAFPCRSKEAMIMKAMISVYFATSLCIGASVFTIKTAALLWFLYGTTNAVSRAEPYYGPIMKAVRRRPLVAARSDL